MLGGAVYVIYDEEELITTIQIDDSGIAYIENLSLGKYYVKEITSSLGYKLDDNNYELEDSVVFEIYDINDNLVGTYET